MERGQLTVAMLTDEAMRIVRSATGETVVYVLLLAALSIALDTYYPEFSLAGGNLLINILDLVVMYLLIRTFAVRAGLVRHRVGGFWSYFGVGLLTGIAITIGLVLLVLPGIVLAVRWAPAYGFVVAGDDTTTGAMGKAWDATSNHFWPILAAIIVPFALSILGGSLFFFAADELGTMPLAWLATANLLIYAGGLATIAVGLAAYSLLSDRSAEIAEVFE